MLIKMRNMTRHQKGFTLVELMVVIAIIGILAAIAVPKFMSSTDAAKKAKLQADLRTIDSANTIHFAQNGTNAADLDALVAANLLAAAPTPPAGYKGATATAYSIAGGRGTVTFTGGTAGGPHTAETVP